MDKTHLFEEWKKRRRQVPVPDGFSDRLMTRLPPAPEPPGPIWCRPALAGALLRWGLSVGLALAGLFRLSLVTYNLLMP
jgi:hypothetical protein